jgi:hypothetical protein
MTNGEATTARATSIEPRYADRTAVLALPLQHHEIDAKTIAVNLLALAELEHERTHLAANDPHYAYGLPRPAAPPRPARVPAPILLRGVSPARHERVPGGSSIG